MINVLSLFEYGPHLTGNGTLIQVTQPEVGDWIHPDSVCSINIKLWPLALNYSHCDVHYGINFID